MARDGARELARVVLGVPVHASRAEEAAAYRRLVAAHHPDHGGDAATFRRLQAAWELLQEPVDDVVDLRDDVEVVTVVNPRPWQRRRVAVRRG